MRQLFFSPRAFIGGTVALVAAVTTALAVLVPTLTEQAVDAGARSVVAARSGAQTGLDLGLPASETSPLRTSLCVARSPASCRPVST